MTSTPDKPTRRPPEPIQVVKPAPKSDTPAPAAPFNQPKTDGWTTGQ